MSALELITTREIIAYFLWATEDERRICIDGHLWHAGPIGAACAAAETAYLRLHGRLPEWGHYLDHFFDTGDGLVIVHADPDRLL